MAIIKLDVNDSIREYCFTVSPLVSSREPGGNFDITPRHQTGRQNHYAFLCAPQHCTCSNTREHGTSTVSHSRPTQIVAARLDEQYPRAADQEDHELFHTAPLPTCIFVQIEQSLSFPFPKDFKR